MNLNIQAYNENTLSDHNPIFYQTTEFGNVLAWNILCPNRFNSELNYFNNGFANIETEDEYLTRLDKVINQIVEFALEKDLDLILLQEAPSTRSNEEIYNHFKEKLSEKFAKLANKNFIIDDNFLNHSTNNSVIYNSNKMQPNYYEENFYDFSENNLTMQKGKYQFVSFQNESGEILDVLNVHLKYPAVNEKITYANDLNKLIELDNKFNSNPHKLLIAGDFNQDLHEYDLPKNADIFVVPDNNVVYSFAEDYQFFDTADGFIYI